MNITEALVITGLGVGVVFSGLILTSLLISSFTFFPNMLRRLKTPGPSQAVPVEKAAISPSADAETAAVIAVLLEVEYRLSLPLLEGRFTFRK